MRRCAILACRCGHHPSSSLCLAAHPSAASPQVHGCATRASPPTPERRARPWPALVLLARRRRRYLIFNSAHASDFRKSNQIRKRRPQATQAAANCLTVCTRRTVHRVRFALRARLSCFYRYVVCAMGRCRGAVRRTARCQRVSVLWLMASVPPHCVSITAHGTPASRSPHATHPPAACRRTPPCTPRGQHGRRGRLRV